jgi:hypothetical protein
MIRKPPATWMASRSSRPVMSATSLRGGNREITWPTRTSSGTATTMAASSLSWITSRCRSSVGRSRLARASQSRGKQQSRNMANFLAGISRAMAVPAIAPGQHLVSDPSFTHWIVAEGHIIGEAREIEPDTNGTCSAYVRLFKMPEFAERGLVERRHLRAKVTGLPTEAADDADGAAGKVEP